MLLRRSVVMFHMKGKREFLIRTLPDQRFLPVEEEKIPFLVPPQEEEEMHEEDHLGEALVVEEMTTPQTLIRIRIRGVVVEVRDLQKTAPLRKEVLSVKNPLDHYPGTPLTWYHPQLFR